MYYLIKYDHILEKYNTLCNKVSADIKKEFDSESVYNKEFWKPKKKVMVLRLQISWYKIPKVDSIHTFLAVTGLDSALKKDENSYPSVFLEECKYFQKKKKKKKNRHIDDNLSDFSCSVESDEE